jgi:hypothetical protein
MLYFYLISLAPKNIEALFFICPVDLISITLLFCLDGTPEKDSVRCKNIFAELVELWRPEGELPAFLLIFGQL